MSNLDKTSQLLTHIRKLPAGTKSKVIASAHVIADKKRCEAVGASAQYAGERILFYDQDTWEQAVNLHRIDKWRFSK